MKSKIHINAIIVGLSLLILGYGCENTDLNKPVANDNEKITKRYVDNCEDCLFIADCCCSLSLVDDQESIAIEMCGTADGDQSTCNADDVPISCEDVNGKGQSIQTMSSILPRLLFCMQEFHGFMIKGNPTSGTVDLVLTCQYGQLAPQSINVQFTAAGAKYFEITDNCVVSACQ